MPRAKTLVAIMEPVDDLVPGCNDLRVVTEVADQTAALKWVLNEGKESTTYVFARLLRTAKKLTKRKTVVV